MKLFSAMKNKARDTPALPLGTTPGRVLVPVTGVSPPSPPEGTSDSGYPC